MDAALNFNDGRNERAVVDDEQALHHQWNEERSSEETFFDYSDVEDGDDDDIGVQGHSQTIHDDNDNNADGNFPAANRNTQEVGTTVLDRHIQRLDWPAVLGRIKSHPRECCTIDSTNRQTPLHVVCIASAPAVIIQTLCQTYPEASIRADRGNMNPLHITCSSNSASLNTVHALLNHGLSEQISMRDGDGDTPLHAACRCGAHKDVIDELLQAFPGAIHVHDSEGLTPLVRLWVRYYVLLGENQINDGIENPHKIENDMQFFTAWDQTQLLLRYAHYGTASLEISKSGSSATLPTSIYATSTSLKMQIQSNNQRVLSPARNASEWHSNIESQPHQRSLSVLHAAAAVDCPRFVVQIAMKKYPIQLFLRDEHGRTPLMIACSSPIYPYHNLSDDYSWVELHHTDMDNDVDDDEVGQERERQREMLDVDRQQDTTSVLSEDTDSHDLNSNECKPSVIELILQGSGSVHEYVQLNPKQSQMMKYSGADWVDPSGRLPLHIAIDSGKTWLDGIDALIKVYPESISIADRSTKMYPYQLAATKAIQNDHSVNDCYELLRLNPALLPMGTNSAASVDSNPSSPFTTNRVIEIINGTAVTDLLIPTETTASNDALNINDKQEESIERKRRRL